MTAQIDITLPTGMMFDIRNTDIVTNFYSKHMFEWLYHHKTSIQHAPNVCTFGVHTSADASYVDDMIETNVHTNDANLIVHTQCEQYDINYIPQQMLDDYVTELNYNYQTPLMYAVVTENIHAVQQLLIHDVGIVDDFNMCALDYAKEHLQQLEALVRDECQQTYLAQCIHSNECSHLCSAQCSQSCSHNMSIAITRKIISILEEYECY